MKKITISKEGLNLWTGQAKSRADALKQYRQELGAEAHDYDAVDPDWTDALDFEAEEDDDARRIGLDVCEVADVLIDHVGDLAKGDVHVAIASLALAMCSLARADGMPLSEVRDLLAIADREVKAI